MRVRSFDLFDTLAAGRDPNIPAGDQPEGQHIPIAENIAKVQPDDVVVSDYYDNPKAERILRTVCKLDNRLLVGNGIKADGSAWKQLRNEGYEIESHTDDAQYAINSAVRAGIRGIPTTLAKLTKEETELLQFFPGLARAIREARLSTFGKYRALELAQIQINFPFLFLSSVYLHRRVAAEGIQRLLMSSRDANLWFHVQKAVRDLCGETYDVAYFLSSRIPRYNPSPSYLKYVESFLDKPSMVVDVCGGGVSLESLCKRLGTPPKCLLLMGYGIPSLNRIPNLPYVLPIGEHPGGDDTIERINFARHPMVKDVREDGTPEYVNPTGIDWEAVPEINAQHDAFHHALSVFPKHDLSNDLKVEDPKLLRTMQNFLKRINASRAVLMPFCERFFGDEEANTHKVLRAGTPKTKLPQLPKLIMPPLSPEPFKGRLLVGILSCHAKADVREVHRQYCFGGINEYGLDFSFDHRYFVGNGDGPVQDDVVKLDVPDDFGALVYKTWGMIRWAFDHGYDYLFKADDDTFIRSEMLMRCGFERHDYMGWQHQYGPGGILYAQGGAGYFLSRNAMEVLLGYTGPIKYVAEDAQVGYVLSLSGIKPFHNPRFRRHYVDARTMHTEGYVTSHKVPPERFYPIRAFLNRHGIKPE